MLVEAAYIGIGVELTIAAAQVRSIMRTLRATRAIERRERTAAAAHRPTTLAGRRLRRPYDRQEDDDTWPGSR